MGTVFGHLRGFDVYTSASWLCSFNMRGEDEQSLPHDVLEVVEGQDCAIRRCMAWEQDCQSVQHAATDGFWNVLRSTTGSVRKSACAKMLDGLALMRDRAAAVDFHLLNQNL